MKTVLQQDLRALELDLLLAMSFCFYFELFHEISTL